jgi:hypothetical protein
LPGESPIFPAKQRQTTLQIQYRQSSKSNHKGLPPKYYRTSIEASFKLWVSHLIGVLQGREKSRENACRVCLRYLRYAPAENSKYFPGLFPGPAVHPWVNRLHNGSGTQAYTILRWGKRNHIFFAVWILGTVSKGDF